MDPIFTVLYGVPLITMIGFIISVIRFITTDKSDIPLREERKKKMKLFGILSLIFIGGTIAFIIMLLYAVANYM